MDSLSSGFACKIITSQREWRIWNNADQNILLDIRRKTGGGGGSGSDENTD